VLVLISTWGAIIPFVGPIFGYSADGAGSWHWSLTHSVLALIPGVIGMLVGLSVLAGIRGVSVGRGRLSLTAAGVIALVCGAWFVIGPWAWPVVGGTGLYFALASPLRVLANEIGYAFGPGLIMAACGGFFIGWASRHQAKANVVSDVNGDRLAGDTAGFREGK
jgi:hypothetical protein